MGPFYSNTLCKSKIHLYYYSSKKKKKKRAGLFLCDEKLKKTPRIAVDREIPLYLNYMKSTLNNVCLIIILYPSNSPWCSKSRQDIISVVKEKWAYHYSRIITLCYTCFSLVNKFGKFFFFLLWPQALKPIRHDVIFYRLLLHITFLYFWNH
jgi:hypothetical protein